MGDRKIPEALYQCEDCEIDCPEASCRPASDLTWVNDRLVCDDCYDTNYAGSEYEKFIPDSARITTLEATLRKTRWHVHGIFGASHPVIIAIDEVLSEAPARTGETA